MAMEPYGPANANPPSTPPVVVTTPARAITFDVAAELRSLHPNVLRVWRLSATIGAVIFGAPAIIAGIAGAVGLSSAAFIFAACAGVIAALFVWSAARGPRA
jgi:hypothetical protein